ncbi:MAG: TraI domain-containing protein [Alphaproteobacteria bacterium]|nr:TraI domain-containing protein [Alphaproteobacteria bacterium]MBO7536736.1 TraI domain-containing protein [Alphaproteobacteria bacterium]MBO7642286.1 TraI domain-containing protein [Alphaproteobacteria bacterium]
MDSFKDFEKPDLRLAELMIVSSSLQKTKRGDDYRRLNLKSADGQFNFSAVMWSNDLRKYPDEKIFRSGNTIKLMKYDLPANYSDYVIHDFVLIKEGKIGLSEQQREEIFAAIQEYVELIKDDKLKTFVSGLLKEYAEAFKVAPAAKSIHHNYLGGLLEHTFECCEIAKDFMEKHPKIDKGTVYAACILHDFGKIWEYNIDLNSGVIGFNTDFQKKWLTHSQWGFSTCMAAGFEMVAKMIAAHHSRTEWGAVLDLDLPDLDPMCYILHHIDDLSAKFGKITVMDLD